MSEPAPGEFPGCGGCLGKAAQALLGFVAAIWLVMHFGRLYDAHQCRQHQRFRAIEAKLGIAYPKDELWFDKYTCASWGWVDSLPLTDPMPPSEALSVHAGP